LCRDVGRYDVKFRNGKLLDFKYVDAARMDMQAATIVALLSPRQVAQTRKVIPGNRSGKSGRRTRGTGR
jgi:hypothetical protein